jgi:hypothetical protein
MQGGVRRLALFVIAELLGARRGHQVERFAIAIDDE